MRNRRFSFGLPSAIREINAKYQHPKITMTPLVRYSLLALRLYLLFMVGVLLFKLVSTISGGG